MDFDNNDRRIRHYELMLCRSLEDIPDFPLPAEGNPPHRAR